jgi:hypothetical protein
MLRTAVLTTCFACVAAGQTPVPSPWQYIHPNAKVIGGIEWHKASQSPFLRELKRELGSSLRFSQQGDPAAMDALEAIYFSAADVPDGTDMKDTSGVALVRARSTLEPFLKSLSKGKTRRQNYNGIEVIIPERNKSADWRVAILDSRHALMGDWPSLRAVLNRTSAPEDTPLVTRAKQLAASADMWFAVNDPGASARKNPMLAEVRGIDGAISLGTRAEFTVQLTTDTPEKAAALATALQMMAGALPGRPKSLAVNVTEATVRITASTTAAEIRAAAGAFEQRIKQSVQASAAVPARMPVREPELPPEKQVVRIYGLDEGVREIPLKR